MSEPGEQRPRDIQAGPPVRARWPQSRTPRPLRRRSLAGCVLLALLVALGTAVAWALLRGVLELGPTALAASAVGGWGIGVALREARAPVLLAVLIGLLAWLGGLLLSWLVAMALLPGSTRTLPERIGATPFLDWLAPQFGLMELLGLLLVVGMAAWTDRPAARPAA